MPPQSEDGFYSSLGFKAHRSRGDHVHISGDTWLEEKGEADGAEGLWRVHDDLYDLTDFIHVHPGGPMWLNLTKGTDITEAFEAHHVSTGPEKLLQKYQIRKAQTPRNSPFTFHEDGFYRTLKREVREVLKSIPNSGVQTSKMITDGLLVGYVTTSILAAWFMSYSLGTLAGALLAMLTVCAHNYFHQKDSFRMYYFDLSHMSSREWRISHVLSHHLYTNTIIDMEIQLFEPLIPLLPVKKPFFVRYFSWLYTPFVLMVIFALVFTRRVIALLQGNMKPVGKRFLIPFIIPTLMYLVAGQPLGSTLLMYLWIVCVGSFHFVLVGVNAAHQRSDIFHDGDTPRSKSIDWGVAQLDTVMDRHDITGSHFLVLTNFGDHALHHLFPTIDHGKLDYLYPTFQEVCKKFGVELRMCSQLEMVKGTFQQMRNETPNPFPPGYKKE